MFITGPAGKPPTEYQGQNVRYWHKADIASCGATPPKSFNSPCPILVSRVRLLRAEIHAFRFRCVGRLPATFRVRFDRGGISRSLKPRQFQDVAIARLPFSTILRARGYLSRLPWQPSVVILVAALKQLAPARSCHFEPEFWHLTPGCLLMAQSRHAATPLVRVRDLYSCPNKYDY
jgi:hypothetical protein